MKLEFTKEMLKDAFLSKKRKRNFMLFKVYESLFSYNHTAETIAALISKDLGIPISKSTIDMTRIRVAKKLQSVNQERKKIKTKSETYGLVQFANSLSGTTGTGSAPSVHSVRKRPERSRRPQT